MKQNFLAVRDSTVVKANDLIQKSRFSLSLQQQKIVLYLISQIKPYDEDFKVYSFDIKEFCKVCGIDSDGGKTYAELKEQIKAIRDKSLWVELEDGKETTLSWIEKPYLDRNSGTIRIRLDNDMKPYLLELKERFTKYELIYTLHFRSKYTIRLYELIKSIHYRDLEQYTRKFELEQLRTLLDAEKYTRYQHFKERVLEPATKEINEYSDINVSYATIKEGRKVAIIEFTVETKEVFERMKIRYMINAEMGLDPDQISLFDDLQEIKNSP